MIPGEDPLLVAVHNNPVVVEEGNPANLLCISDKPITHCYVYLNSLGFRLWVREYQETFGFKYFGTSYKDGECGITIKNASQFHNGNYTCIVVFRTTLQFIHIHTKLQLIVKCENYIFILKAFK